MGMNQEEPDVKGHHTFCNIHLSGAERSGAAPPIALLWLFTPGVFLFPHKSEEEFTETLSEEQSSEWCSSRYTDVYM